LTVCPNVGVNVIFYYPILCQTFCQFYRNSANLMYYFS
jgi:hypothetical protein